jgi:hypothetical protein
MVIIYHLLAKASGPPIVREHSDGPNLKQGFFAAIEPLTYVLTEPSKTYKFGVRNATYRIATIVITFATADAPRHQASGEMLRAHGLNGMQSPHLSAGVFLQPGGLKRNRRMRIPVASRTA